MRKFILNLGIIYFFSSGSWLAAQSSGEGKIGIYVRNFENAYSIKDAVIEVTSTQRGIARYIITTNDSGYCELKGPTGKYELIISKNGFNSLKTHLFIQKDSIFNVNIWLDPSNKLRDTVQYKMPKIEGYIVDEQSGKPIFNAEVLIDQKKVASSNEKGYFSFIFNEFSNYAKPEDKIVSKDIYIQSNGYAPVIYKNILMFPTKIHLNVLMKKGEVPQVIIYENSIIHGSMHKKKEEGESSIETKNNSESQRIQNIKSCSVPSSIRVGTGCSCTNCSGVQIMSLQSYVESGLDDEWVAGWQMSSLEAGSIAYRSYGGWYVNNPVNPNYDIASSTCNQAWGSAIYGSTQNAAQNTTNIIVSADGVNPARAEYSAENNYGGSSYNCGDCYAGGSGLYSCFSDNACCGYSPNGHGRGMCQWGTQRWAQAGYNYSWIVNHYYVATVNYIVCNNLAPSNLVVTSSSCPKLEVTLSWQNSGNNWYVDVSDDPNFSYFWNKNVSNVTSVVCPGGFCLYGSACNSSDYLAFQPNTTYYWRIWDGSSHTYGASFTIPYCFYSDTACSGSFYDTGGPNADYSGNEDYTFCIYNSYPIVMNFGSIDLEAGYDSLWIWDGSTFIGGYTGTISPGIVTANSGTLCIRFKSDPYVNMSGWTANWNCISTQVPLTSVNHSVPKVFPIPAKNIIYVLYPFDSFEVEVYNLLGMKIYWEKNAQQKMEINTSNWKRGVYIMKLTDAQRRKFNFKVIKEE